MKKLRNAILVVAALLASLILLACGDVPESNVNIDGSDSGGNASSSTNSDYGTPSGGTYKLSSRVYPDGGTVWVRGNTVIWNDDGDIVIITKYGDSYSATRNGAEYVSEKVFAELYEPCICVIMFEPSGEFHVNNGRNGTYAASGNSAIINIDGEQPAEITSTDNWNSFMSDGAVFIRSPESTGNSSNLNPSGGAYLHYMDENIKPDGTRIVETRISDTCLRYYKEYTDVNSANIIEDVTITKKGSNDYSCVWNKLTRNGVNISAGERTSFEREFDDRFWSHTAETLGKSFTFGANSTVVVGKDGDTETGTYTIDTGNKKITMTFLLDGDVPYATELKYSDDGNTIVYTEFEEYHGCLMQTYKRQ